MDDEDTYKAEAFDRLVTAVQKAKTLLNDIEKTCKRNMFMTAFTTASAPVILLYDTYQTAFNNAVSSSPLLLAAALALPAFATYKSRKDKARIREEVQDFRKNTSEHGRMLLDHIHETLLYSTSHAKHIIDKDDLDFTDGFNIGAIGVGMLAIPLDPINAPTVFFTVKSGRELYDNGLIYFAAKDTKQIMHDTFKTAYDL